MANFLEAWVVWASNKLPDWLMAEFNQRRSLLASELDSFRNKQDPRFIEFLDRLSTLTQNLWFIYTVRWVEFKINWDIIQFDASIWMIHKAGIILFKPNAKLNNFVLNEDVFLDIWDDEYMIRWKIIENSNWTAVFLLMDLKKKRAERVELLDENLVLKYWTDIKSRNIWNIERIERAVLWKRSKKSYKETEWFIWDISESWVAVYISLANLDWNDIMKWKFKHMYLRIEWEWFCTIVQKVREAENNRFQAETWELMYKIFCRFVKPHTIHEHIALTKFIDKRKKQIYMEYLEEIWDDGDMLIWL